MELIRGIHNIRACHQGCVLTIGNFDGVHLGHQAVIEQLVAKAKQLQLPATVMLFEPQPLELFMPETAPARLTVLREKYQMLAQLGIDRLLVVNFNAHFSAIAPQALISSLFVAKLGVKFLVVGDDFRFGAKREGDFAYLQAQSQVAGFDVVSTQSFAFCQQRVSSTAIREQLALGNLTNAAQMLGRPFSVTGRVSHGKKLGRKLGFPTANIPLKRRTPPVSGVFVVKVKGIADKAPFGVANIGIRPTVNGVKPQLEVHLFDLNEDLYGLHLEVQLLHKLRNEKKFSSLAALQAQIEHDVQAAHRWLAEQNR